MKKLYIADYIEYDSWSGRKQDGYVAFSSKEAFDEYQADERLIRKNELIVPDYYVNFENGRYEDCSIDIHDKLNESLLMGNSFVCFNKF